MRLIASPTIAWSWLGIALTACVYPGAPPAHAPDAAPTVVPDGGDAADADRAPDAGSRDDGGVHPGHDAQVAPAVFDARVWERSVIYFVITDRFANGDRSNDGGAPCTDAASDTLFHGGDFMGLAGHLDYLTELGADTIWITPVREQIGLHGDQCGYHGYWADLDDPDDLAIEPRLGGAEGLDALIESMHARGMRLVVDHVVNHPGYGARITRTRPEWFHPPAPACEALGPRDLFCPLANLPDFAHERGDVADYLDAQSVAFVERFAFDGFRLDTVKHVPLEYWRDRFIPAVTRARPSLYLLGELWDESSYPAQRPYLDAGLHGLFDFPLRRALIQSFAQGSSLDPVAARVQDAVRELGVERARLRSTFMDNHDVPRFLSEMEGLSPDLMRARFHLALAVLFTTPGVPQITYGTELAMLGRYPENRRSMPAWAFDRAGRRGSPPLHLPEPGQTFDWMARLAQVRASVPALAHGGYAELWRPNGNPTNVWGFFRSDGESRAIVLFNGGEAVSGHSIPLQENAGIAATDRAALADGAALDERLGTGASARIEGGRLVASLPARSVAVFEVR